MKYRGFSVIQAGVLAGSLVTIGFCLRSLPSAPVAKAANNAAAEDIAPPLTDEALGKMLKDLGFNPKESKTKTQTSYTVDKTISGWDFHYWVTLSPDRTKFWILQNLLTIPDDTPRERFMDLLEANSIWGPSHFRYLIQYKMIVMARARDNLGITQQVLKDELDFYGQSLIGTEALWNPAKWTAKTKPSLPNAKIASSGDGLPALKLKLQQAEPSGK